MPGGIPVPESVILSWPATNRVDPQTAGLAFVITTSIFGIVAIVVVSARMWARFVILRSANIDDYLILAAVPPTVATVVLSWMCVGLYQWNHHVWDVTVANIIDGRKAVYILQIIYVIASCLIKISVLFFYRHLALRTFSPWFKRIVRVSIISVVIFLVGYLFVVVFCCVPMHSFWMQFNPLWASQHSFKCISPGAPSIMAGIISMVQDFVAVLLPLSMFIDLKMGREQKVALMGVFALGFFTCIAGTMRVYYVYRIYYVTYDGTWESYHVFVWANIELLSAMICASAPSLKIFIRTIRSPNSTIPNPTNLSHSRTQTTSRNLLTTQKCSTIFSTQSGLLSNSDKSSSEESSGGMAKKTPKEARIYDSGIPWYREDFLAMEDDLEKAVIVGNMRGVQPGRKRSYMSALAASQEEDVQIIEVVKEVEAEEKRSKMIICPLVLEVPLDNTATARDGAASEEQKLCLKTSNAKDGI